MTRQEFTIQVKDVQGPLRRLLTALCLGDATMADDIAQESLIKAYLAIDSLTSSAKFRPWLYRIAYNTFLNQKRYHLDTVDYDHLPDAPATAQADDSFRYQQLYLALDSLSAKERTAILLFYMEDYSIKEIAQITGASTHSVKQQLSRGRKHLKDIYGR